MIGHQGEYGRVTTISRQCEVSRQTLYQWEARGQRALAQVFAPASAAPVGRRERAILTLLVAGHASERGIQACLAEVGGQAMSLGTISAVVREAGRRALALLARPVDRQVAGIALDEIYDNDRHGGYLSVVDAHSGVGWGTAGPVGVDGDSWTLLLWLVQERGLSWLSTVHDGSKAIEQGCARVDPAGRHQREVWHILHECGKVQGRLDRQVVRLSEQAMTVARQAILAGFPPAWRPAAALLCQAWDRTVRARSVVENWHSILRPIWPCIAPSPPAYWLCGPSIISTAWPHAASTRAPRRSSAAAWQRPPSG